MKIMNTSSMYFNKFSSGTILAMLALSGMLFLVPLAVPAHATQNASLPTLTMTPNAILAGSATGVSIKLTNPASNAYAVTSVTVIAPTGWTFTVVPTCSAPLATTGASSGSAFQCTGSLPPGFSATLANGTITPVASPATSAAPTGMFTTSIIDAASTPAAYAGPSFVMYSVASGTTIATVVSTVTSYTAGSAPATVTATLSTNQAGVPIVFSVTTAPSAGFTATVSPTSGSTASGVTAASTTTSFQPSNHATDATTVTATIGTSAISTQSQTVTTIAGNPTTVSWTTQGGASPNFNQGSTFYLSAGFFGSSAATGGLTMAEYSTGQGLTVSMSDPYGNPIAFSSLHNPTIAISATSGTGFDQGGNSLVTTATCVNSGVDCGDGDVLNNYYQSYTYGAVASLTAIITGNYPLISSPVVSVSSASGNFVTGTQAASYTPVATSSAVPAFGAGSTVKLTASPNTGTQPGVPVTFNLCGQQVGRTVCAGTTVGYAGSFVGGSQLGFVSSTSGATGTAIATYTLDPTLGNVGIWNASAPAPTNAVPTAKLTAVASNAVTTVAGAASTFKVFVYFSDQTTAVKSSIVAGQTTYIVVQLVDAYGNIAANPGPQQIQIQLAATAGTPSATTVYIASGGSATNGSGSFGQIQWIIPAATSVGTVATLTATGVVSGNTATGTKSITVVTPLPSLSVTSPLPVSGTIYSSSAGVTFKGWANASAGYNPSTTTIASVNYKIGSASWLQAAGAGPNNDPFAFSVFVPVGLSTITFNATDSNKNTAVSSVYNVLVDIQPPTFTFGSATSNNGCVTVTAATSEGDFNPATFTATYGGNAVPSGAITWSGTQVAGTAGSLTANICGLVSGTATLSVTGSTWAGLSATATESLTVTVPFADSVTFNTASATYGTVGAYKGVTISVTNGWNTAQTLVVYATFKSGTSIYVADGTVTLAAGATAPVFCIDLQTIPPGSYTVTFAAVTTSNQAVSAPTTGITLVAT
jgi:hypothetical protein